MAQAIGAAGYGNVGIGFMDGEYMALGDLRIPVFDLGFQLSDMCYDALRVWDGRFFRQDTHMERFDRSIRERRYNTLGYDIDQIGEVLHECVRRSGLRRSMVTVIATRGTPTDGLKDLRTCRNRLMAWAAPYYTVITEDEVKTGCDVVVSNVVRIPPDSVDPTIKNFARLDFCRALFEAYDRGSRYALLIDKEGNVTEGRGWNIFALKDGRMVSPDSGVLEGVTRRTVLELSQRLNIKGSLGKLKPGELRSADEVFLTSTAGGVMPVRSIDGKPIGDAAPGPVTRRLSEMFWALNDDPNYSTPVRYDA